MRLHQQIIPRAASVMLAFALLTTTFLSTGCSSSSLAKNADRVASALTEAQPIFQTLIDGGVIPASRGAQIISRLTEGAADAKLLADAFRNGDNTSAIDTTAKLIGVMETLITDDAALIPNSATRTTVMAILGAADIALHIIADNLIKVAQAQPAAVGFAMSWAPPQSKQSVEVIRRYAARPRLRCRDARTGRFLKMEQCKANPQTTIVERVK